MGRQHHFHGLVDVAPFRVMVALLCDQRDPGHEAERLVKILESKGFADRLPALDLAPAREGLQSGLPGFRCQTLHHFQPPLFSRTLPRYGATYGNHDADVTSEVPEIC